MPPKIERTKRRSVALSKERIVEAAIDILDANGEGGLTFRALAAQLRTGAGAIYWHVADKHELLAATTHSIISRIVDTGVADPPESIRALTLGVFDAIDEHPWVGAQLAREPWQLSMLEIFERIGKQLEALEVPEQDQFDAASAILNFVLGLAGQYAAGARQLPGNADRSTLLREEAVRWANLDPTEYAFMRRVAAQMGEHDDRKQFLAGINLILTGIDGTDTT